MISRLSSQKCERFVGTNVKIVFPLSILSLSFFLYIIIHWISTEYQFGPLDNTTNITLIFKKMTFSTIFGHFIDSWLINDYSEDQYIGQFSSRSTNSGLFKANLYFYIMLYIQYIYSILQVICKDWQSDVK